MGRHNLFLPLPYLSLVAAVLTSKRAKEQTGALGFGLNNHCWRLRFDNTMYDFPKPPNISNHDGSNVSNDDQSNVPNYSLPFRAPPREPIPLDVNEWGEFASPSVSSSSFSSGSSDPLFHYHARPERSDEALDVPHDVQDMDWEYSEEPILSPLIAAAPSPCSSPIPLLLHDSRESPHPSALPSAHNPLVSIDELEGDFSLGGKSELQ
ncbi:hypothetical protein B0H16DRAFT_1726913 [Mycena metata]|uniref:Uncharacterized protein n=1 Tax=Mycena metata TaxID=1033252 RepID=A0AAD7INB7_9AGAR|nr:hypothetical protein B0H16DRAFT_1726913 [Mycena metata]